LAAARIMAGPPIEIDHQEIDRRDVVGTCRRLVIGIAADGKQPAVHLGMQRLHPAVHHLRKAGVLGDVLHLQPGSAQRGRRTTSREDLDSEARKRLPKLDEAALVGDRNKRAADLL